MCIIMYIATNLHQSAWDPLCLNPIKGIPFADWFPFLLHMGLSKIIKRGPCGGAKVVKCSNSNIIITLTTLMTPVTWDPTLVIYSPLYYKLILWILRLLIGIRL